MITHHPEFDLLFDYAAGSLPEPMALSIATHASTCKHCHDQVQKLEEVGGTLLEEVTYENGSSLNPAMLDDLLAKLDDVDEEIETPQISFDDETLKLLPKPIRSYLPGNLNELKWRNIGSKVSQYDLGIELDDYKVSLMRFKAGSKMPIHEHKGNEVTLVLSGAYQDEGRRYGRGDFDIKGPEDVHQPKIEDDEDCIALVVMDAPILLAGPFSRFLNPFFKL